MISISLCQIYIAVAEFALFRYRICALHDTSIRFNATICRTTFWKNVGAAQAQGMKRVIMSHVHLVDVRAGARTAYSGACAVLALRGPVFECVPLRWMAHLIRIAPV